MSTIALPHAEISSPPLPPAHLPSEDGVPLESAWHFLQIALMLDMVNRRFDDRQDFYAGGYMFIYFNLQQMRNQDFRGPDFYFVRGVKRHPLRKHWAVWDEGGKYPDFLLELLSSTTAGVDKGAKKEIYEKTFRTPEYFLYDPETKTLEGWRLDAKLRYKPVATDARGWAWSEQLGAWLGKWQGKYQGQMETWLRLFDDKGEPWPTFAEKAEVEIARLKATPARKSKNGKKRGK